MNFYYTIQDTSHLNIEPIRFNNHGNNAQKTNIIAMITHVLAALLSASASFDIIAGISFSIPFTIAIIPPAILTHLIASLTSEASVVPNTLSHLSFLEPNPVKLGSLWEAPGCLLA